MKFLNLFTTVLLWVIVVLLDPAPDSEYGSGFTDLVESGSNSHPDPQPLVEHNTTKAKGDSPSLLLFHGDQCCGSASS